ncbi:MAG TPA: AMP-binding protein [Ideonella sp.]|nr:AMP-binding protein [Ideonella sp.]
MRGGADDRLRPPGTSSYVAGATDEPLRFVTISQLLDEAVAAHGARDAAVFPAEGRRLSWYDLQREADAVAAGLLALGIRRGNRVGIWAPNRTEWLLAQFGTARIGAILVNINPAYQSAELEYALNKVRCRALVMARGHKSSDYLATLRSLAPELARPVEPVLESRRLPHLRHVIVLGTGEVPARAQRFADFVRQAGPAQHARLPALSAALDPDDAINIQFTSGTTGAPKGATLSHFNIVNNARFCARAMALTEADRLCIPVPLYHCFGMVLGVLACVAVGATMVFPGEGFDAQATLDAVERQRCTALHGVPTMFVALLALPDLSRRDVSSLRTGIMAGAPCPIETMRRVVSELHMREVTIGYGMTETSPVSFPSGGAAPLGRRVSTVGRIHPHVEVKIVDAEGRIVPVGAQGELCTRGYSVMRGYWEDAERTREAIDEAGWMHTGDLATLDAEGWCNIVGRVKDMLIRGGENVFPREIEDFIATHEAVQDVQVFGIPDARLGEEVCAWVVPRPGRSLTAEDVLAHCRGRIAHYKVPRHVRIVAGFPLTATGKAQKFAMREAMMKELGLREAKTA